MTHINLTKEKVKIKINFCEVELDDKILFKQEKKKEIN